MAIKVLKTRLAASWTLLLFLTTATIVLQHAGATTSSTAGCDQNALVAACDADTVCSECRSPESGAEWVECTEDFDLFTDSCSLHLVDACCYDATSANDCLGNDAFVESWLCFATNLVNASGQEGECTTLPCSDDAGASSESDDDCFAELSACLDDEECNECLQQYGSNEYIECATNYDLVDRTDFCAVLSVSTCCLDEISGTDCLGSDVFVENQLCVINSVDLAISSYLETDVDWDTYFGTTTEECTAITCSDGSSGAIGVDGTAGVGNPSPSTVHILTLGLAILSVAPVLAFSL